MNEAVADNGERPRLSIMFWLCYPVVLTWLGFIAYWAYTRWPYPANAKAVGIAAACALVAPIAWLIADWLRLIAMPEMLFTRGFIDTLQKKVFWAIGPQVGVLALICAGAWITAATIAPPGAPKPGLIDRTGEGQVRAPAAAPAARARPGIVESTSVSRASTADLCTLPATLHSLKESVMDVMVYNAKVISGRDLPLAMLRNQSSVSVEGVEVIEGDAKNATCAATLSFQVSPDLHAYGLKGFVEEGAFFVSMKPDGSIEASFAD